MITGDKKIGRNVCETISKAPLRSKYVALT
jgi:hypothetical protein